jgi:hypothetical protein
VSYLRRSLLYGREFVGGDDLDAQRQTRLDTVGNPRVQGTTREVRPVRLAREEQVVLRPLAARPYQPLVLPATCRPSSKEYAERVKELRAKSGASLKEADESMRRLREQLK